MKKKSVKKSNRSKKYKPRNARKEPPKGQLGMGLFAGDQRNDEKRNK